MDRKDFAREVVNRAKRAGEVLLGRDHDDDPTPTPADVHAVFTARMEEAERIVQRLEAELAKSVRIKGEYFGLIEKMERQRDEWRELYHTQSRTHHNAQVLLETYLTQARQWLGKAIILINQYRKAENKPLVQKPDDIDADAPPIGTAAEFKKTTDALAAGAKQLLDAKVERATLDEEHEAFYAAVCQCGHARSQHATEDRNCLFEEGCTCEKFDQVVP